MRDIKIIHKANGVVLDVGDHGCIFDTTDDVITELQRYYADPAAVEAEYENGNVPLEEEDPVEEDPIEEDPVDEEPIDLTIPTNPTVTGLETLRPTFSWDAVEGADSYLLHASQGSEMTINAILYGETTFTPTYDMATGTHHWRVRALVDAEFGPWTDIYDIVVGDQTTTTEPPPEEDPEPAPEPVAGSTAGDIQALETLYSSTGGSGWTNNTGWSTSGMSLNAYGVETATIDGKERVVSLNLKDNNLSGTLPSEIGNLTALTYLNVMFNHITGSIPSNINNAVSLEYLYLNTSDDVEGMTDPHIAITTGGGDFHAGKQPTAQANGSTWNEFSGTIPDMSNLSNLKWFVADWGNFNDMHTGIFDCTNLEGLHLKSTKFNGVHFGDGFQNLDKLTHLTISNGNDNRTGGLIGTWDAIFGNGGLPSIVSFRIGTNQQITGSMPPIVSPDLGTFIVKRCYIEGPFPASLVDGSKPNMMSFLADWPEGPGWSGTLPEFGGGMPNFTLFTISGHSLEGEIPASFFHNNPGMMKMNFRDNNFTSIGTSDLTMMYRLRNLRWQNNNISGKWPNLDWGTSKLDDMQYVEFGGNNYSSADKTYVPAGQSKTIFQLYNELPLDHFWY